jgi:hypothetical protein
VKNEATQVSRRIAERIARYRANPVSGEIRLVNAVRGESGKMARKKAASPAQIAARKAFAAKFGGKKSSRKASAAADNPTKKRRKKRRANPTKAAAPAANPKKKRRKKRRANPAAAAPRTNPYHKRRKPRRRANPQVAGYTRKKSVKGHYRKPAKKTRRRRDNPASTPAARGVTVHTHMHGAPVRDNPTRRRRRRSNPAKPPAANPKRRRKSRRRSNPAGMPYIPSTALARSGMLDNPSYSTLFENPMGAYSMDSLKAFGIASAGVGLGLLVARGIDRFVATMKPAKSKDGKEANRAWYGKAAVSAINRRPNAMRLGVQAAGAVVGIGAAYALKNKPVAPWLFGGIALGFGANLLLQVMEWYAIPYFMKTKKEDEQTLPNRLYVLEQVDTQDKVDLSFEDWGSKKALADNQDQNTPLIYGPLNSEPSSTVFLGRGAAVSRPSSPVGVGAPRRFVPDGRVGHCNECGGDSGHYSGCGQCDVCNGGGGGRRCLYTVEREADIYAIAQAAGVEIGVIAAMNGGGTADQWWVLGRKVQLPEAACNVVINQGTPEEPRPDREPFVPIAPERPEEPRPDREPFVPIAPERPERAPEMQPITPDRPVVIPAAMMVRATPQPVNYALAGGEED